MKTIALLSLKLFVLASEVGLFLLLALNGLYVDVINPDGINWHARTVAFTQALKGRDFSRTFQAYHPGTTLMWISGPLLNLFTANGIKPEENSDQKATFLQRDYLAKLAVVVFSAVIFLLVLIALWKLISLKYAVIFGIVLSLEPFVLGMRRLYHLDFVMTLLMFLSFLLILLYSYKTPRSYFITFSGLFYALALLTKSTAVLFLPVVPVILLLGNHGLLKKILALLIFAFSTVLFLYIFFPPVWRNPVEEFPNYVRKIFIGVTEVGVEGKKELGTSGKQDNILLDESVGDSGSNFYLPSLIMRTSMVGVLFIISGVALFLYLGLKGLVRLGTESIRKRYVPLRYEFAADTWLCLWSLWISTAVLISLSISAKKTDRYEIIVFPFLLTFVAYLLNRMKTVFVLPLTILYIDLVCYELRGYHPHYLAYSNPYLGGIKTRISALDNAPFGVGTYAAFDIVQNDRKLTGLTGYYTVAGSKSVKAISAGGKFSRFPSCVTDYIITYATETKPVNSCTQRYMLLDTVNIHGFDYWYVYKRLNQAHESNYD